MFTILKDDVALEKSNQSKGIAKLEWRLKRI